MYCQTIHTANVIRYWILQITAYNLFNLLIKRSNNMKAKKILIIVIHAFIGWALCGATIGIGRAITTMEATLIIHAIAAPIIFTIVATYYFKKFAFTKPLMTAVIFVGFVIAMDAGLVAPVFEKNYTMFQSLIGTWIPFALIFTSTYITGFYLTKSRR